MSNRDRYAVSYAHASRRPLIQRALTVAMVITGVTLLLLARVQNPVIVQLRASVVDALTPAVDWLSQPVTAFRSLIHNKDAFLATYSENTRLRGENDTLRHWQAVASSLKAENDALRALSGYKPVSNVSYITARIVGQSPNGYSATLLINAGSEEGIETLQPVVDAYGLIGRVTEVGKHSARVLLLTDSASRVPVITGNTRYHAIAGGTGGGDDMLRLSFLGGDADSVALGEQVVTTEEGGLIPGGIVIGTVFRRDANGLLVKPVRPLAQSEYVRVIAVK